MKARTIHRIEDWILICGVAVLLWFLLQSASCGGALTTGYRATLVGTQVRDAISTGLAEVCKAKHETCLKDKAKYKTCIADCKKDLELWVKKFKPAVQAALLLTVAGLEVAHKAKDKKYTGWLTLIKPAICGLAQALLEFKDRIPTKHASLVKQLKTIEGVVCQ